MTGNSRGHCGRALKRLLLITSAIPLMACSSIPMPRFVDDAFPGVFAPSPMMEAMEAETDTEEMVSDAQDAIEVTAIPAMFVRTENETDKNAPIKLSPGAARALGVAPLELAKISVTAIRKEPQIDDTTPFVARSDSGPDIPRLAAPRPLSQDIPKAPIVSFLDPYLQPSDNQDGFVEVAQAVDPDGALRVQDQLAQAAIPAEIQEDFVEGRSVFRVFASAGVDHDTLGGTLEEIRFVGAEGSEDGTLIAEMPNFNAFKPTIPKAKAWVAMGTYQSRNEAMSIIQKMARKSIPGEICTALRTSPSVWASLRPRRPILPSTPAPCAPLPMMSAHRTLPPSPMALSASAWVRRQAA